MINQEQINIIKSVLVDYLPSEIGIFGSYARGENRENSDLDILVTFGKRISIIDLIGLEQELSEKLSLKVDLVTRKSLSPLIKDYIEKDLELIS